MTKVINKIPYFSQWESPKLVGKIIERKILARDDQKWKNSGAKSPEEYEYWSWNICGMACLKMILASKFSKNYKMIELAKKCEEYGAYVHNGGHLVLITGFDDHKKTLFFHNPSGFFGKSQENCEISEKDFKKFFASR